MDNTAYTPEALALLAQLHEMARKRAVSYDVSFEEGEGSWYITINSPSPKENFVGKNRGYLEYALADVIEYLETLGELS